VNPELRGATSSVKDGSIIGLDPAALSQRLGPASNGKTFLGWDEGWYLGPDSACVDSRWLVVRFGPDGRVKAAGLYND
jgi:hypothetical protein